MWKDSDELLVAYIDESGDTGAVVGRSSRTYTLGCVLVSAEKWATAFEDLLALRRRLRNTFGLPIRAEVKANHLIRSGGAFKQLAIAPAERHLIYRAHLNQLHKTDGVQAFAVMAHKSFNASAAEVLEAAWIPMLQRLERASHYSGGQPVFVVHDEGENRTIRKLARRSRRRLTAGSLGGGGFTSHEFRGLVDDPFPKASHESYMLQLADLVAYAAFRRVYAPGPAIAPVVNEAMWAELRSAVRSEVTSRRFRTVSGIVEVDC